VQLCLLLLWFNDFGRGEASSCRKLWAPYRPQCLVDDNVVYVSPRYIRRIRTVWEVVTYCIFNTFINRKIIPQIQRFCMNGIIYTVMR